MNFGRRTLDEFVLKYNIFMNAFMIGTKLLQRLYPSAAFKFATSFKDYLLNCSGRNPYLGIRKET